MDNKKPSGPVAEEVEDTLAGLGYGLVEFSAEFVKGRMHVHSVVHHPDGVSLDRLGEVHRVLEPRLEMLLDARDLYVEFSSPGIERKIKSFHEFALFRGRRVSILPINGSDRTVGMIDRADDLIVAVIDDSGKPHEFAPGSVNKARLLD